MSLEDQPGYRELYRDFDHAPLEEKLKFWRQTANRSDYALKLGLLARPESNIDIKELEKAPLFAIDKSFPQEPPIEFQPGEEPALAPMTQEQFRILLTGIIPDKLKPFMEQNFVFSYDAKDEKDVHTGPALEVIGDKVHVTLHRDDFLTKGTPPITPGPTSKRSNYIWSYVDPSKISFLIGKIIGIMIEPDDEQWNQLNIDNTFRASRQRIKKDKKDNIVNRMPFQHKQWQDFIGLCIAMPEEARTRFPDAYAYYEQQQDNFLDPKNDAEYRSKLDGVKLNDFDIIVDLRTDAEKAAAEPLSAQRNIYDKLLSGANIFLAEFGWRLRYTLPEDEERAQALADDDKEVARLIENYDEEARDRQFGEILATAQSWDKEARNKARRYLIAASREGEFDDWRIYAWLYKFSDRFRNPRKGLRVGSEIDEDDYLDLKIIYKISEKEGGRIGTGVLPYEPVRTKDSRYAARDEFTYLRRDNYLDAVRRKIDMKSARGVYEANPKVFDQFVEEKKYINDLDAGYTSAHLLPYLRDRRFTEELVNVLDKLNTKRVSPDARAVAEAYWHHFLQNDSRFNQHMSEKAIRLMQHYGNKLDRPASNRIREFLDELKGIDLSALDPEKRQSYITRSDDERKTAENSILSQAEAMNIREEIRSELLELLQDGIVQTEGLREKLHNFIKDKFEASEADQVMAQMRSVDGFLLKNDVANNLESLRELVEFHERAQPLYSIDIVKLVNDSKTATEAASLIVADEVDEATYLAKYASQDFALKPDQLNELEGPKKIYQNLIPDSELKQLNKARAGMLRNNILTDKPEVRLKVISQLIHKGIADLQTMRTSAMKKDSGYEAIAEMWRRDNPVFDTKALQAFTQEVEQVLTAIGQAQRGSATRTRLQRRLTKDIEQLELGLVAINKAAKP